MSETPGRDASPLGANPEPADGAFRQRAWRIIFLSDTPAGRAFDIALLWAIGISVLVVMLESVVSLRQDYGGLFRTVEWFFTVVFTLEYVARLAVVRRPVQYARSFGVIDLLSFSRRISNSSIQDLTIS